MNRQRQDIFPREFDPVAIKKQLIDRRLSVADLARKIKRSRVATSGAIHNPARYPEARRLIEKVLGHD